MITIECDMCHKSYDLPVEASDVIRWNRRGIVAQKYFPKLTDDQRELLISQTCGSCFDELCPLEDE